MRCLITLSLVSLASLAAGVSPASAGDQDVMRWLGIGWGPGYHAYNNCGKGGNCGNCGVSGWPGGAYSGVASPSYRAPAYQASPTPAARPAESLPPQRPMNAQPPLAPPMKPSEEAARAGRYYLPSGLQQQPTYLGQRYPRMNY